MERFEIERLIKIIETTIQSDLLNDESEYAQKIKRICDFVIKIPKDYDSIVGVLEETTVRFCDYYDDSFSSSEIVNYFEENYHGKDKNEMLKAFVLYVFLKKAEVIVYNYENADTIDELCFLLGENEFDIALELIGFIEERSLEDEQARINSFFEQCGRYQTLFTGLSFKDIEKLDKDKKMALIRKLANDFAIKDIIPHSEAIEHVKSAYDFPVNRTYLGRDHRIAYVRRNDVTVILGVSPKTGNDDDYTRFDSVAKNKERVYSECDLLRNEALSGEHKHFKTMEMLKKVYLSNQKKENKKN